MHNAVYVCVHACTYRLLQQRSLWLRPETRVLVLGDTSNVDVVLQDSALRNTHHALYITPARAATHWVTGDLRGGGTCVATEAVHLTVSLRVSFVVTNMCV